MLTLEELYREYAEGLQAYAVRLTRETQAAEDLVQEAFIRTLGHLQLLAQFNVPQENFQLRPALYGSFQV